MKAQPLIVYLPDTRGVQVSRFGKGNAKIGHSVFTYSRLPGHPSRPTLGMEEHYLMEREAWLASGYRAVVGPFAYGGTCPGSSPECEAICYARRPVAENGAVYQMWLRNSHTEEAPTEFPPGCTLVRLHVSGDFTSVDYIEGWIRLCESNPGVLVWAYTRSWRVPELVPALERLRALPNVQLFASMDQSIDEMPPDGWRRAWINGDWRADAGGTLTAFDYQVHNNEHERNTITINGVPSYVCPEETGHKANCEECGYCFRGKRNDVTFLRH